MGKTWKDKEYERDVHEGQCNGPVDDFIKLITGGSSKGYEFGSQHRRDSEGNRFHTWDKTGSNDSKEESPYRDLYRNVESCPICGSEYDGVYCYCDDLDDDYETEKTSEPLEPTREQVIAERLEGKKESELWKILMESDEEDLKSATSKRLSGIRGRFKIYPNTSPEVIKRELDSGLYSGVAFVQPDYLCTYECTRCGHEWEETRKYLLDNPSKCVRGCSDEQSNTLSGLYKIIKGLITSTEPFGHGKLIKSKKL